eukprot:TRINITY_DN4877_c3_g1_i1.p2 TRINITY_DN4877_c3_g1~~TRINITY_DN4877_c3_g1_i1.p2  ORF type:complete len:449 (+),score=123.65 TRINITY_DN4877_c3_g1_i1:76-1347(+)
MAPDARPTPRRPRQQPDRSTTVCMHCRAAFSLFRRRHHCRSCGEVFCGACSKARMTMPPSMQYDAPQRVCIGCCRRLGEMHAGLAPAGESPTPRGPKWRITTPELSATSPRPVSDPFTPREPTQPAPGSRRGAAPPAPAERDAAASRGELPLQEQGQQPQPVQQQQQQPSSPQRRDGAARCELQQMERAELEAREAGARGEAEREWWQELVAAHHQLTLVLLANHSALLRSLRSVPARPRSNSAPRPPLRAPEPLPQLQVNEGTPRRADVRLPGRVGVELVKRGDAIEVERAKGPARAGGLRPGHVIERMNGCQVTRAQFREKCQALRAGDEVVFTLRGGTAVRVTCTPRECGAQGTASSLRGRRSSSPAGNPGYLSLPPGRPAKCPSPAHSPHSVGGRSMFSAVSHGHSDPFRSQQGAPRRP